MVCLLLRECGGHSSLPHQSGRCLQRAFPLVRRVTRHRDRIGHLKAGSVMSQLMSTHVFIYVRRQSLIGSVMSIVRRPAYPF